MLKKYEYDNLYIVANLPYYVTTPIISKIIEDNLNKLKQIRNLLEKKYPSCEIDETYAFNNGMKKVFDEANINIPFSRIDVSIVANDSTSK